MPAFCRRKFLYGAAALLAPQIATAKPPVDESGFVSIGGLEQWIAVQGQDTENPAILYLHGGPGEAQSPFLAQFRPWEQDFTLINWDQRGSGRTFGRNGAGTPDMSLDRMASDTIAVAEYALRRLAKPKLILVGQSWGAILGLVAVQRRPELFYAFVGTGQPVNATLTIEDREKWARTQAANDSAALKQLDDVRDLSPTDVKRVMASGKWMMAPADLAYLQIQKQFTGPPPFPTEGTVADWVAGYQFTARKLYAESMAFDARKSTMDMPIPCFVIQGRDDHVAPFDAAQAYVRDLRAPQKAFIAIDGGHYACFTSTGQFLSALQTCVGPMLPPRGARSFPP
jgi:pimeloyl-ACP methyl ester carboxylesterase